MFTLGYGTLGYVALGHKARAHGGSGPSAPEARASSAGRSPREHSASSGRRPCVTMSAGDYLRMCQEKPCQASSKPVCHPPAWPASALALAAPARALCPLAAAGERQRPGGSSSIEVVIAPELHRGRSISLAVHRGVASRLQQRATAVSVWRMATQQRCTTLAPRLGALRCCHAPLPGRARTALTPRSVGRVNESRLS